MAVRTRERAEAQGHHAGVRRHAAILTPSTDIGPVVHGCVSGVYASLMTPDEVGRYAESLPEVKRKGTESHPAWYVRDRLVVRVHDQNTVVIRVPLSKRELLLETYPDSFGVPPRMEAHHKVEAYLDRAQPRAVHTAIDLAWEMQRR
jgi:hypothetical protein